METLHNLTNLEFLGIVYKLPESNPDFILEDLRKALQAVGDAHKALAQAKRSLKAAEARLEDARRSAEVKVIGYWSADEIETACDAITQ